MADAQTAPPAPQPQQPQPPQQPAATGQVDEKTWALFAHLSALTGFFTMGIGTVVGPLLVWLIGKEKHPFIDRHGKEALNFGITVAIAGFALMVVGMVVTVVTLGLGGFLIWPLGIALAVAWVVFVIMAAMSASNGEEYRYPVTLRFVN